MFIHQNLTLFIAVALPVHGSNMLLQLFKFTPFPIPTTHNTHVIPILATPFLAVNSMTDQYRELTAADFSLCKEFNALLHLSSPRSNGKGYQVVSQGLYFGIQPGYCGILRHPAGHQKSSCTKQPWQVQCLLRFRGHTAG